jgi:radical SAM superfamily enzyme YgiQ (UPF0313 family)
MKVGLLDIDGHNYPNLALMKISAYHKSQGDFVEWALLDNYDQTYMSKIFTFTEEHIPPFCKYGEIIKGGTGYNLDKLPDDIDKFQPDYSIYPQFKSAYGFLTRGCPNKCSWCVVPKKEGGIKPYMTIKEIAGNRKEVILMGNNVLASDFGLQQIEQAIRLNLKLDFNQGLDTRLINNNIAQLLSKVKWKPYLRMACDSSSMKEPLKKAITLLRKYNTKPQRFFIYILLKDLQDSYERVNFCKELKCDVHSQPFRNFTPNQIIPQWQSDMARYTNHHGIYKTVDFKEYQPRKGFTCNQYFK